MDSLKRSVAHILGTALTLWLCLTIVRGHAIGYATNGLLPPLRLCPYVVLASYYDSLYVAALTLAFVALSWTLRRKPRLQTWASTAYTIAAVVSFATAVANVPFIRTIGRPFNYQWLYYSDFLQSFDARHAILANVTAGNLTLVVLASIGLVVVSIASGRLLSRLLLPSWGRTWVGLSAVGMMTAYFFLGHAYVSRGKQPQELYANPIVAFTSSYLSRNRQPGIFTMPTRFDGDEFLSGHDRATQDSAPSRRFDGSVRNVAVIVLESVAAQYVEPFGGRFPVTPTLSRYRSQSALFQHIYAHAPHTNTSLWSLESGLYPWITYRFVARDYPRIEVPSLSLELERRGYRTAFFNSSDNRFQNTEDFLRYHGFDRIEDWRSMRSNEPLLEVKDDEWPYQDGIDDLSTLGNVVKWIDEAPREPFFVMTWSMMTHYPYFATGTSESYVPGDEDFNRYLNGLRHTDNAIAQFLEALASRDLAEKTLVVVVGDHGECFFQHGVGGHGRDLYEESVHVPLQLINPVLFRGEEHALVGGLVDVPATILDVLNLRPPDTWQGQSLFEEHHPRRVYFFAPTSDYWFGYREGDRKCLYNASRDEVEIYDLESDPTERRNLVAKDPESAAECKERLASWVQYQNRTIERLLEPSP